MRSLVTKTFISEILLPGNEKGYFYGGLMIILMRKCSDIKAGWKQIAYDLDDSRRLQARVPLYSIRIAFSSIAPVIGEVYFDNIGFKVRSEGK
jgi:hypothetical protein